MKKRLLAIFSICAIQFAAAQTNNLKNIIWLIGNWKMSLPKGSILECWKHNNDSTLQGKCYFIELNGDTIPQESVQLVHRNGTMFYIPTVNGQNNNQPVSFKLISYKNNTLIFENPAHDFPQKIIYALKSTNELDASVEGISKGRFRKDSFPMIRVR